MLVHPPVTGSTWDIKGVQPLLDWAMCVCLRKHAPTLPCLRLAASTIRMTCSLSGMA